MKRNFLAFKQKGKTVGGAFSIKKMSQLATIVGSFPCKCKKQII